MVKPEMGNAQMCSVRRSKVKLILFEGTTTTLTAGKHIAGEIMFQYPDMILCHADSFFIGHPLPSLSIHDPLHPGHTYFLLPVHKFSPHSLLSAASLSAFSSSSPLRFGQCPFQYIKGHNGRVLIKVMPEFLIGLINNNSACAPNHLCSTPELKKHYDQLVRSKHQTWSPKLHTISEKNIKYSPCKFLGLHSKHRQNY